MGRGRARASCYLLLDPEAPPTRAAEKRLQMLAALERPGAGLEISVRDLDLRGAGDILGPTQAGHVKLIGLDLFQQLLERAIATAQGHTVDEEWQPELRLGVPAIIPADYIPEDELRVRLYRRIADAHTRRALDGLEDEIEDRFGPPPEPTRNLLELAWLRRRARRLGLQRIDAGPEGVAVTFRGDPLDRTIEGWKWREERLVRAQSSA
ncbi:MAG: TRCF domain-containing protein [Stellaceae bacterium]